jgi:hypothetical protein
VLKRTDLALLTRLKHLEALEVAYTKMVEGTPDNGWRSLLELSLRAKDVDPDEIDWSILEVRRAFVERSKDINIVSTLVLRILAPAKMAESPRLGTRCAYRHIVAFTEESNNKH